MSEDFNLESFFHLSDEITTEEMMILDNNSKYLGIPTLLLMENAGCSIVQALIENQMDLKDKIITIFAGLGNNGGDTFVVARHLTFHGSKILLFLLGDPDRISSDISKLNWEALQKLDYCVKSIIIRDSSQLKSWKKTINESDIIIDGILGTGVRGKLREPIKTAISLINNSNKFVCSVDVPSGVNPDTGEIIDDAIKANMTVTFHKIKSGLKKSTNIGKIIVKNIGIPPEAEVYVGKGDLLSFNQNRSLKSHKGDSGRVLVIGGNETFSGAPALVSLAAYRTGSDLVMTVVPSKVAASVRAYSPNLIVKDYEGKNFNEMGLELTKKLIEWPTAVAIGPGLGREEETNKNVIDFLSIVANKNIPTVIDADALKAIKDDLAILKKGNFLLTPHLGEYNILSNQNLNANDEMNKKIKNIFEFAKKIEATILLKGHYDIISNGRRLKINKTGTPAMTVGGTGDVLTGITASLMGMKIDPMKSACIGAFINGIAGELATNDLNGNHLLASDLLDYLPKAFHI
ncbi:MAG: NAD(P)H-hydrate dehydratase [Candidatus Lokiarchaeota archaeon]|nr:NAD(P)H-hydrate dehydratase [Candidatus Lokiarchaeota archaeon]